jgi:hypothetical protein
MLNLIKSIFMAKKTKSKTSPKGGNRGCLCDDGKYKKECCNGDLQNQGIGSTIQGRQSTVTSIDGVRTRSVQRG